MIDDYSRAICGYMVFTGAPSALNTALALRQAIWRKTDPVWAVCGLPDVLHVDHGSDFTSHHLEYTAVALKIRLIFSTIGRPQGRGKVERFFGTLNTELLAALPGYLAPGAKQPKPSLDLKDLDQAIAGFITTYNERTHREVGTSPKTAWIADGWLPRMPETLEELDGLLLTVPKNRTVQRDGIHFQGQRYLSPTLAPVRRQAHHNPLRPARYLRDPRLRPRHLHLRRHRRSAPEPAVEPAGHRDRPPGPSPPVAPGHQ